MRNIRLKPLYLPKDDIFVQPPSFLYEPSSSPKNSSSKKCLTNLTDLKSILKNRRFKSLTASKPKPVHDDQESVLKLSDFKPPQKSRSPLTRKYTFRRSYSNLNQDQTSSNSSPIKVLESQNFMLALHTIFSTEKVKGKNLRTDVQKFTENNKVFEAGTIARMDKLTQDIAEVSELIAKLKVRIKTAQTDLQREVKAYGEQMNEIMNKETNLTLSLHSVNGKKKHPDVNEERDYFIVKEALREKKRHLHESHVEMMEKAGVDFDNMNLMLNQYQTGKKNSQKEFRDQQETLINFYCMNLKEGMDLREDGIRWTIKSLWKMKESVPVSAFPRYLDDESSQFLLFMAEKDLETVFLQAKLNQLREEIKKEHMGESFTKSPKELFGIVQERLKEIKKNTRAVSMNSSEIIGTLAVDEGEVSTYRYEQIKNLKNQLRNDEKMIASSTMEEVKRVVANYNPETAKNIGVIHIIRALVGDKIKEFRKVARFKTGKND